MTGPDSIDVRRTARLAGLRLTGEEARTAADELRQMVGFADLLRRADTEGVPPAAGVAVPVDALRVDKPAERCCSREELLANAPAQTDGYFAVPDLFSER